MTGFKTSVFIGRPLKTVFQAYIDPDNMLKWSTDLVEFKIVKGKFGEKGATAHLYYKQKGRIHIMEDRLEYFEPEKKIISSVSGEGLVARVQTVFSSMGEETGIEITWEGRGKNLLLRFLLPFLKGTIRNRAHAELILFKSLVEEHGVKFK
jgi:uncharacterized protein YndB with AHSA1/START domain